MEKKVVLITGAASGIGRGCVLKFLENKYKVVMIGRDLKKLETFFGEIDNGDVVYFQGDISKQAQIKVIIDKIIAHYGRLDAVVNNAGICTNVPFIDMTYEQYDEVVKINQYGTFICMQIAAKKMIELQNRGVIVNVSSIFYDIASPGIIHYHASKGAVSMMSKAAALELAPYGIRVLAVAPGIIDTPMLDIDKQKGTWDELQKKHMRKKALLPEEVAEVIVFLCSDKANGINASVIPIDDGLLSKY